MFGECDDFAEISDDDDERDDDFKRWPSSSRACALQRKMAGQRMASLRPTIVVTMDDDDVSGDAKSSTKFGGESEQSEEHKKRSKTQVRQLTAMVISHSNGHSSCLRHPLWPGSMR